MSEPLSVAIAAIPGGVLADVKFLDTLAEVERSVAALKITDAASAQAAADIQVRLTSAGTQLEKARKAIKQPFLDAGSKIDAAAKAPADRIEKAKSAIKTALSNYSIEVAKAAREAEAKRAAEAKALADKLAAERAAAPDCEEEAPDLPTAVALAAVKSTVSVEPPKLSGVREVVTLFPHITDVNKLGDEFVIKQPRLAVIQSTFCKGWKDGDPIPTVAGIRFEVQRTTVSTGRPSF